MQLIRKKIASSSGKTTKTFLRISKAEWIRIGKQFGYWGENDKQNALFDEPGFSWERKHEKREYDADFDEFEDEPEEKEDDIVTDIDHSREIRSAIKMYVGNRLPVDDNLQGMLAEWGINIAKEIQVTPELARKLNELLEEKMHEDE